MVALREAVAPAQYGGFLVLGAAFIGILCAGYRFPGHVADAKQARRAYAYERDANGDGVVATVRHGSYAVRVNAAQQISLGSHDMAVLTERLIREVYKRGGVTTGVTIQAALKIMPATYNEIRDALIETANLARWNGTGHNNGWRMLPKSADEAVRLAGERILWTLLADE